MLMTILIWQVNTMATNQFQLNVFHLSYKYCVTIIYKICTHLLQNTNFDKG